MRPLHVSAAIATLLAPLGCRPAGYVPPAQEATPPAASERELTPEELQHQALFGVDSAPPSVMKPPKDATISDSGLSTAVLRAGTGQRTPRDEDTVVLHFTGWNSDGERFDSSVDRGKPDRMRIEQLVPGWREGVQQMVVGEKRRLWVPERLAFGNVPTPGHPSGDIVLDVELLEIVEPPKAPDVPEDVAAAPADAGKTETGLRYKILKVGTGAVKPTPTSRVVVHYAGWQKDGTMFDSSYTRGEPAVFGVIDVIPGWTEILQLMVVGEQRRVWIPAELAYGEEPERPGAPSGDLVFDIELIDIE